MCRARGPRQVFSLVRLGGVCLALRLAARELGAGNGGNSRQASASDEGTTQSPPPLAFWFRRLMTAAAAVMFRVVRS